MLLHDSGNVPSRRFLPTYRIDNCIGNEVSAPTWHYTQHLDISCIGKLGSSCSSRQLYFELRLQTQSWQHDLPGKSKPKSLEESQKEGSLTEASRSTATTIAASTYRNGTSAFHPSNHSKYQADPHQHDHHVPVQEPPKNIKVKHRLWAAEWQQLNLALL